MPKVSAITDTAHFLEQEATRRWKGLLLIHFFILANLYKSSRNGVIIQLKVSTAILAAL